MNGYVLSIQWRMIWNNYWNFRRLSICHPLYVKEIQITKARYLLQLLYNWGISISFVLYLGILEFCRLLFPRQILYNPFLHVLLHLRWFYTGSAAHRHNLQSIYSILRKDSICNQLWVDKNEFIVSVYESFLMWGDNLIPSMQNERNFSSGRHYIWNCKKHNHTWTFLDLADLCFIFRSCTFGSTKRGCYFNDSRSFLHSIPTIGRAVTPFAEITPSTVGCEIINPLTISVSIHGA